jgi:hypothetical protein
VESVLKDLLVNIASLIDWEEGASRFTAAPAVQGRNERPVTKQLRRFGMKKKVMTLAVSAALAAPAAYADVTLTGNINAGPAFAKSNDGSSGTSRAGSAPHPRSARASSRPRSG